MKEPSKTPIQHHHRTPANLYGENVLFRPSFKSALLLLTALSGAAFLSSCSFSSIRNPFGSQRPDQVVEGERHTPIYNVVDMQKIARSQGAPPSTPILPVAPALAAPMVQTKNDSFDYYSAAATQPKPDASGNALGNLNPAPMKVDAARFRKPLQENSYAANTQVAPAPLKPVSNNYQTAPAVVASSAPIVAEKTAPVAEPSSESGSSFFSRMFTASDKSSSEGGTLPPWKNRGALAADDAVSLSERNDSSPSLSSVPQSPSQFNDIKSSREQEIQNLKAEFAREQAQKQMLSGEPSQQQHVTPVEMPAEAPPAPPAAAPHEITAPVAAPATSYPASVPVPQDSQAPRSPRRGIDIMTQEEWEALQKAKTSQQSTPAIDSQQSVPQVAPQNTSQPASQEDSGNQPASNPNGTNNLIMTTPPDQRSTPVPVGGPQSALPAALGPLVKNEMESPTTKTSYGLSAGNGDEAANSEATEVAEDRPSFFARLLGITAQSAEKNEDTPALPNQETATQDVIYVPAAAVAPVVAAAADAKQTEGENVATQTSGDWLQSLVSGAQARPVNADVSPSAVVKDTAADQAQDDSPKIIGHMSDKAMMQLVTPPQANLLPGLPSGADSKTAKIDTSERVPANNTAIAEVPSSAPALKRPAFFGRSINEPSPPETNTAKGVVVTGKDNSSANKPDVAKADEQPVRRSFFSRLLGSSSTDSAAVDPHEDKTLSAMLPPPELETKEDAAAQAPAEPAAKPQAAIENPVKLNELTQDEKSVAAPSSLQTKVEDESDEVTDGTKHRPSFFSRLLSKPQPEEKNSESLPVADTASLAQESAALGTSAGNPDYAPPAREYVPFSERPSLLSFLLNRKPASESDTDVVVEKMVEPKPVASKTTIEKLVQPLPAVAKTEAVVEKIEAKSEAKVEEKAVTLPAQVEPVEKNSEAGDDNNHRPSFFSRLFSKSDKPETSDESVPVIEPASQEAANNNQAPAAPAPVENPIALPTPLVTTTAAPVAPVATDGAVVNAAAKAAAAAANTSSSLPSPRLLDQVKTLPVSRYSTRARAIKQPSDDN